MNLSAQDHQTFFTGDTPQLRPEDAGEFESFLFRFSVKEQKKLQGRVNVHVSN